jgi:hypothetical protein
MILSLSTNYFVNQLIYVMVMRCVFFAVGTECLLCGDAVSLEESKVVKNNPPLMLHMFSCPSPDLKKIHTFYSVGGGIAQ